MRTGSVATQQLTLLEARVLAVIRWADGPVRMRDLVDAIWLDGLIRPGQGRGTRGAPPQEERSPSRDRLRLAQLVSSLRPKLLPGISLVPHRGGFFFHDSRADPVAAAEYRVAA